MFFRCSSTQREAQPWWTVDLGRERHVNKVVISRRGDCCGKLKHLKFCNVQRHEKRVIKSLQKEFKFPNFLDCSMDCA